LSLTLGYAQKLQLEKTCFSTKWEDWGPRKIGDKMYCLSAAFACDTTMIDPYTLQPYSDLYEVKGCLLEPATFTTKTFGVGTSMSSNFYDGQISGNSKVLFFTNNHGKEHNLRLGIFYAFNVNNKWSDPLVFPFNSLEYNVSHPFYDEKNGKFYFVSDKGSLLEKNEDIYVCSFDGKSFGTPTKVAVVNTGLNELAPLVYKDTLYFSSNGFNSMGGYDMYKLVGGKVVSMGPEFNSVHDDLAMMYDSDTSGYFTSDRHSKGADDDIIRFVITKEIQKPLVTPVPNDTLPQLATLSTKEAIEKLVQTKNQIDSLRNVATEAGVSPDLFAFLNMALAQYEKDFPESMEGKSLEEINTKISELLTVITLINQQIDIAAPKPTDTKVLAQLKANKDTGTTLENKPITIDILANDSIGAGSFDLSSIDLDPATPGIQQRIVNEQGTWNVQNGKINFDPKEGFNGFANITYVVADQKGNISNPALITIDVLPVIAAPIAENDFAETKANKAVTIPVTQNDDSVEGILDLASIDFDPNTPGLQQTMNNSQGTWTVANGAVIYKPASDFKGMAIMSYAIKNDGGVVSNVANVTVNVAAEPVVNAVKVIANNDVATTKQGQAVIVDVLINDLDPEGALDAASIDLDPTTVGVQQLKPTSQGTWSVANGVVTFSPAPDFVGKANLTTYTVKNKNGIVSNVATISINVLEVVSAPVAQNDQRTAKPGEPTLIDIASNSSDPLVGVDLNTIDLDPSSPGIQQKIINAQGTWIVENGKVKFIAAKGFSGTATIPYTVKNTTGTLSNVALLSIEVPAIQVPTTTNNLELAVINSIIDQSKIENIHFEFDKYAIIPEYQKYLRGLSMLFSANPEWQIHLSGHTDSLGTNAYNMNLSKNRSESAKQFLVSCGIAAERITYEYHGEEIHIATNSTPEGRYQNRRVEIAVSLNGKKLYDTGVPK
jgi:CshA-type fibril repeat protein